MPYFAQRDYATSQPSSPSFTYRLGAASAGKRTPPRSPKYNQDYWVYASTHKSANPPYLRSTKEQSGEDAFFATTVGGSPNHVAFGVADGVGGWQDQGIDPSDFSHGLCGLMAGTAYMSEGSAKESLRPRGLLQTAYDAIQSNPRILAGGATASLGMLNEQGRLECANLGDSGFMLFAPGKISGRSEIQTHAFNTPYQMSKIPPRMHAQESIFGGSQHLSEKPNQADVTNYTLKHGDIVVFATDGVWDNLSAQDTLEVVTRVMSDNGYWFKSHNFAGAETMLNSKMISSMAQEVGGKNAETFLPGLLAAAVMREAKMAGLDRRRNGPFAKEVNQAYPDEGWQGGKPDDIAVVVCVAVEEAASADEVTGKPIKAKL